MLENSGNTGTGDIYDKNHKGTSGSTGWTNQLWKNKKKHIIVDFFNLFQIY